MIIASQKRKENIAEYLLYMWQIEDLIRANSLDMDKIKTNIIDRYPAEPQTLRDMAQWYESLIDMMRREDKTQSGHLQMNINIIGALADLNKRVLEDPRFDDYRKEFYATLPYIVELRSKAGDMRAGEIETCFNALYGVMMLRLKGAQISDATAAAVAQISKFVALLAKYFYLDEHDQLFKDQD